MQDHEKTKEQLLDQWALLRPTTAEFGSTAELHGVTENRPAEKSLRESEKSYTLLMRNIPAVVFRGYADWSVDFFDDKIESLTGYPKETFNAREKRWADMVVEEDLEASKKILVDVLKRHKTSYVREYRIRNREGGIAWVQERSHLVYGKDGRIHCISGVFFDITEHQRALASLQESEERHRTVLEAAPDPVAVYDVEGRITYVNPAFSRVFGWSLNEIKGVDFNFVPEGNLVKGEFVLDNVYNGETFSGIETRRLTKDGRVVDVSISGAAFSDIHGKSLGNVITFQDITEKKKKEEEIAFIAYHDTLTGLPNRKSFYLRLEDVLSQFRRRSDDASWALLFLDLDRFKIINDTLGHDVGDELLKAVARRIRECLRKTDDIFRLGGDEFTVILSSLSQGIDVAKVAEKIREKVSTPVVIKTHELQIWISIGISVYPNDGADVETLVKNADMALYAAKEEKEGYRFFTDEMNRKALERMQLERNLRFALERDEFVIYYQPLVDSDEQVVGMEALLRWQHPELGLLPPGKFIGLAEETGAIIPIGEWVLRSACQQVKRWQDKGYKGLYVAVNLSARQFREPDLVDTVEEILNNMGIAPNCLKLEVTESCVMDNPEMAIDTMNRLREKGINFSIDDFGTGYSSLSYLKRLPIDTLKIDRSFVCDALNNREDREIIRTIVSMARSLNIETVAEGVETKGQQAFLRKEGCKKMQGYYFGRPMPEDKFEEMLRSKDPVGKPKKY